MGFMMNNNPDNSKDNSHNSVLMASLLLPGLATLAMVATPAAHAENAPEKTTVAFKLGSYQDSQADWDRVKATAPQLYIQAPIASDWAIEASAVRDNVSGASPYFHTQKTGASGGGQVGMKDERNAGDVRITRYLGRATYAAGVAISSENDYKSAAIGFDGRWSSEDNNTTWSAGLGASNDVIDNTHSGLNTAIDQKKTTREIMVGVTQVLTPKDIVQFNITRSMGSGYFNDPYKLFENRPDFRNMWIGLARWNHYVEGFDASLKTSYRYYNDTFGVQSHTFGVEWVQPMGQWTFTPAARYHTQKAADFFIDPVLDAQGNYDTASTMRKALLTSGFRSGDQRLSGFGAVTLSFKAAYAINTNTSVDFKIETYRQSGDWALGGGGTKGLDDLNAQFYQIGITHRF